MATKDDYREREDHEWMTPGEVADMFRVDPKTAARWVSAGKIPNTDRYGRGTMRTPGGHIRFRVGTMRAIERGEIRIDSGHQSRPATTH